MNNKKNTTNNNLFPLRKYLTPEEASVYLLGHVVTETNEVGVLQLALEGTLTLSVNLLNWTYGLEILDCQSSLEDKKAKGKIAYYPFNSARKRLREILNKDVSFASKVGRFKGVWDIILTDLTKILIQNRINELSGNPKVSYTAAPDCICLENSEGKIIGLTRSFKNPKVKAMPGEWAPDIPQNHRVNTELPENSVLVVRKSVLDDLKKKDPRKENSTQPYMDPNHPFFAKELFIAVHAWTELYADKKIAEFKPGFSHKPQIRSWIEKKYPVRQHETILETTVERIAKVVNPNKPGGQPSLK